MTHHLTDEELTSVVAGEEIAAAAATHLEDCVACRAEAARLEDVIEARRIEIEAGAPDWDAAAARVMEALPDGNRADHARRPRWLRPALAMAATLLVAVGVGVLLPGGPAAPPTDELAVEEILAEMDELLSDDSIPGFEIIDPETGDLETYFDNGAS